MFCNQTVNYKIRAIKCLCVKKHLISINNQWPLHSSLLKRGFFLYLLWKTNWEKKPPPPLSYSLKPTKAQFLKRGTRGVLRNNSKANVEKWELRRVEIVIESVGIVLNAIPRGGRPENKRPSGEGASAEVKLCQPELRPDERTGVDLWTKCKPAPACLKRPAFIPGVLDVIISPVGHVPSVDSPHGAFFDDIIIFLSFSQRP